MEDEFHISISGYLLIRTNMHFYKHFIPDNSRVIKKWFKEHKAQLQLNDFYLYLKSQTYFITQSKKSQRF